MKIVKEDNKNVDNGKARLLCKGWECIETQGRIVWELRKMENGLRSEKEEMVFALEGEKGLSFGSFEKVVGGKKGLCCFSQR